MFEWKVEDMVLLNQKGGVFLGKEKIYDCEHKVSREDKIAFVDSFQEGKLSYLLELIEKFNADKETMPKDQWDNIKTVSLKAWIKKNDTKYGRPIVDNDYRYGRYYILGMERFITYEGKGSYDTYEDLVDELFHRQLKKCEEQERSYFLEHDEYSILKSKLREYQDKYRTSFGVHIVMCSSGEISVYNGEDYKTSREITMDELKDLIAKYEQVDVLIGKLTEETHIVY